MKIAVEGCCHGELDKIYETIEFLERQQGIKVDLLLCCGDFQAVRNPSDLGCMAVPQKYQQMNTFYKYYSGEKKAPILTIFIGGNHEASNYLQELPYGGWVAPNIYYLGYAGVVQVGGVRIGGHSGIYKPRDYNRGRFEHLPYSEDTKRSVYHIRNFEVFRLKQISRPVEIFLSHDWPASVYKHGNYQQLARFKPYFAEEMENNKLGSPPAWEVLKHIKPHYWFSAHLHCKFAAIVQHEDQKETRFLALDKCLPKRRFLQLLDVPHDESKEVKLELDPEWMCILKSTNHLLNTSTGTVYMPGPGSKDRHDFTVKDEELQELREDFGGLFAVPDNFEPMADPYHPSHGPADSRRAPAPKICLNPQTQLICEMLDITDPNTYFTASRHSSVHSSTTNTSNPAEIQLESSSEDEEEEGEDEPQPTYDTFIISQNSSSAALSTSKIDESFDNENFVTALDVSPSERSQDGGVAVSPSERSQDGEEVSGIADVTGTSAGGSSPSVHLLSPPHTSSDDQVCSSSEKESSAYLSPTQHNADNPTTDNQGSKSDNQTADKQSPNSDNPSPKSDNPSPKRPREETEGEQVEKAEPDSTTKTTGQNSAKKFKRRNQSMYSTPEHT